MDKMFKVTNTTCKDQWVAIEIRSRGGNNITPAMRRRLRNHQHVLQVVAGKKPDKLFVVTAVSAYAQDGRWRRLFVATLSKMASTAK